jgi:MarR family transcriptional regulator, organic hydroperoxide resistance regulator
LFSRPYQVSNLMRETGSRSLAKFGSTTQQWAVLGAPSRSAVRKHGMTVKELIESLLTSGQNFTDVLNRLEQSRLVERVRMASDRRIRLIRLTEHGPKIWNRMLINIRLTISVPWTAARTRSV